MLFTTSQHTSSNLDSIDRRHRQSARGGNDMRHLDHSRKLDATAENTTRPPVPRFCMPAMPPLGLMASIENRLHAWRQHLHHNSR